MGTHPSENGSDAMGGSGPKAKSKWRRVLLVAGVIIIALVVWAAIDLYGPRTSHLRDFDPDEVARLETAMWRSYYAKQEARLFSQLGELLRKQYNLPLIRSNQVAYHAAKAAYVFKSGKQRSDYEKVLPDLVKFYQAVREVSDTPFDVKPRGETGARMVDHPPATGAARRRRSVALAGGTTSRALPRAGGEVDGAWAAPRRSDDYSRQ